METPYGELSDRFVPDMSPVDMHDSLHHRYRRRTVLKGLGALGLGAALGPVLWRQSDAYASTSSAPQWIAYGADPATQMWLSWSTGTASGTRQVPPAPQVRWGFDTGYGAEQSATRSGPVPVPASVPGEPTENTIYNSSLLTGLHPGTTYHYSVSNDGSTWSPDATFQTADGGRTDFRFTAFGDHGTRATSTAPMAALVARLQPAFCLVSGDLSYATPLPIPIPETARFHPEAWDSFLGIIGPAAAQSIPWQVGVGTHEIEPLDNHGYDGFLTRFPQPYDSTSGSPVVHTFTYGNVAVIQLDGNDLSAQATQINGYSQGGQTRWLEQRLMDYRRPGSPIDFIVVTFGNCVFSTNQNHGSDGGIRAIWEPLFDRYQVDLVINGHVHAYERTNPMRGGQPTTQVASGGEVYPQRDGTTYICAGGAGQGLYRTWYGRTDSPAGDAGDPTAPKVWQWTGGDSASGGSGDAVDVTDTAEGFSAFRRAHWHCLVIDVTVPGGQGDSLHRTGGLGGPLGHGGPPPRGETRMSIRAVDPAQTESEITDIDHPAVMDSVILVRQAGHGSGPHG